jgi:hypothetical protein
MTDRPVFLSASLPDPQRSQRYFDTADLVAIREATRALASVVLRRAQLVFGGHPAITPLVRAIAQRLGHSDRVRIYQSAFFMGQFPADNNAFPDLVITPSVGGDRAASLLAMREAMIGESDFRAAVFLGGMEGVEEEHALFVRMHPRAMVLPVASTGAAAAILYAGLATSMTPAIQRDLTRVYTYAPLFKRLLGYR